jgi:hypothetical protein
MRLTEQDRFEWQWAAIAAAADGADPALVEWVAAIGELPADVDVPCPPAPEYRATP